MGAIKTADVPSSNGKFWWSNAIFFVGTHIAAAVGVYFKPPWAVPRATLLLCLLVYQASCFGCVVERGCVPTPTLTNFPAYRITIGYHRLYSHRAFRANFGVRMVLAALGSMAFQGSIKVGASAMICTC